MQPWAIALIVVGAVLVLVVAIVAWVIAVYNKLVRLRNVAEEGYSTMDVYMKKRYDLIPNLVETVKGYATHENETLTKVMEARYSCMSANDPEDRAKKENMLTGTLKTLFNVAENYPNLKADADFNNLQKNLELLEVEIAQSRKYYNGCVREYNTACDVFPSNLIASRFKFERKPLFEVDNAEERVAPKVKF